MPIIHENVDEVFGERRIALVAGVNSTLSSHILPLQFAIKDAEAMAKVLEQSCHFDLQPSPLFGSLATTNSLKKGLRELARNRNDDDFLLFYFSGHASLVSVGKDEHAVYLVTSDFQADDVQADEDTHISLQWILNYLETPTQAGKVLIILDCCFSGTIDQKQLQQYYKEAEQQIQPALQGRSAKQGLRLRLTATGPGGVAIERNGHGLMTDALLKALRGEIDGVLEVDNGGKISLQSLHRYLERVLPRELPPSLVGNYAGKECILAAYPEKAALLQNKSVHFLGSASPPNYIPPRNALFQERPGEFAHVDSLLFAQQSPSNTRCLALIGMGGIGKTCLAIELASRYGEQKRFPGGVFWILMPGTSRAEWQQAFADFACDTEYLPVDDDESHPENQMRRARHFCRYLVQHSDALLILDNVTDPDLVMVLPSAIAGEQVQSTLLYTSRIQRTSAGVTAYHVDRLPPEAALHLLLKSTRSHVLADILANKPGEETQAAQDLCRYVDYLPLALIHIQALLRRDYHTSLVRHLEALRQRGSSELDRKREPAVAALFATFQLSWERVHDEMAQRLFKLAVCFKEASTLPLWLLGLGCGIGEREDIFEPLGEAKLVLQEVSLIEVLTKDLIRIHPLVREFGQRLLAEDQEQNKRVLMDAAASIANAFVDMYELEKRARGSTYWECLEQLRVATAYTGYLDSQKSAHLASIERWLSRESFLLGSSSWWPRQIPALFYQQLYRQAIEDGQPLKGQEPSTQWLRQLIPLSTPAPLLLKSLEEHTWPITRVALSQDASLIATSSRDRTIRIWEAKSGKLLDVLDDERIQQPSNIAFTEQDSVLLIKTSVMVNLQGYFVFVGITLIWDMKQRVLQSFSGEAGEKLPSVFNTQDGTLLGATPTHAFIARDLQPLVAWESSFWHTALQNADSLMFSPDQKFVLLSYGKTMQLRETRSGKLVKTWRDEPNNSIHALMVATSTNGAFFLEGSRLLILHNQMVTLYDVAGMEELGVLHYCNPGTICSIAISPKGDIFATGSIDGYIHLWRLSNGDELASWPAHSDAITCVIYSLDGSQLLTGSLDNSIHVWEVKRKHQLEQHMTTQERMAEAAFSVAFSPDGTNAVTGIYKQDVLYQTQMWETTHAQLVHAFADPPYLGAAGVTCVRFSPDGCAIATGSVQGVTRIWDAASGRLIREWKSLSSAARRVESLAFSPQQAHIATGYDNGIIHICDIASGRKLLTLRPRNQHLAFPDDHPDNRSASCIAFSPDGKMLVAGYWDRSVRLWDCKSGKMLQELKGHTNGVSDIAFSPDGTRLLTASFDQTARLWDVASGKTLAIFKEHSDRVKCVAFSSDGKQALSCDKRGLLFLWHIHGLKFGERSGVYRLPIKTGTVYWRDDLLIVADCGGTGRTPRFFHMKVEKMGIVLQEGAA